MNSSLRLPKLSSQPRTSYLANNVFSSKFNQPLRRFGTNSILKAPIGDKRQYTDRQKREAQHIAESYEKKYGWDEEHAKEIAWRTVNKLDGGGLRPGGAGYEKHKDEIESGGEESFHPHSKYHDHPHNVHEDAAKAEELRKIAAENPNDPRLKGGIWQDTQPVDSNQHETSTNAQTSHNAPRQEQHTSSQSSRSSSQEHSNAKQPHQEQQHANTQSRNPPQQQENKVQQSRQEDSNAQQSHNASQQRANAQQSRQEEQHASSQPSRNPPQQENKTQQSRQEDTQSSRNPQQQENKAQQPHNASQQRANAQQSRQEEQHASSQPSRSSSQEHSNTKQPHQEQQHANSQPSHNPPRQHASKARSPNVEERITQLEQDIDELKNLLVSQHNEGSRTHNVQPK